MRTALKVIAAFVIGALSLGLAWAGTMEARFGNTVVATAPDGTVTKFYYDADGKVAAKVETGGKIVLESKGKWRQDGAKLCLTFDATFGPFEANTERCVPLNGDKVGDTWPSASKDAAGNPVAISVTIVAGR